MNNSISIILVEPENPDNIGAVARAMKNMGFRNLRLIKPPRNWKIKARKLAMSAWDVLQDASVFSSLKSAIRDVSLVVGTTRRKRKRQQNFRTFTEALTGIKKRARRQHVAIVFGKESKGLDNNSLALCDWMTSIPTDPACPSINLAQAVMLIAFSLFHEGLAKTARMSLGEELPYVSHGEIHEVLRQFRSSLEFLGYQYEGNDTLERIVATFHDLIKRSGLIRSEVQMLRGLTRRIRERVLKEESVL